MSEAQKTLPAPSLIRPGTLALVGAGRKAFREVPGLRMLMVKGFLLLYGLFAIFGTIALVVFYRLVFVPMFRRLDAWQADGGFFMDLLLPLLNGLLWIAQLMLTGALLVVCLLLSLSMMSLWFEALCGRIVSHRRGLEQPDGFSLRAWARSLARAVKDGLWVLLLSAAAMVLGVFSMAAGFVFPVGPLLVFLINAYLMGWEIREPYLSVRETLGDDRKALRKGLAWWTIRAGLLPVFLAMIPIVGWIVMPMILIYQVAGMAWVNEQGVDEPSSSDPTTGSIA
ncbi:MAG: EI24 domain-containing protein [bacterium]